MPPSQAEIARAFGFKGVRAAQYHLEALEAAGAIVEPMSSFMTPQMLYGMNAFFEARSYNDVAAMDDETRGKVLPFIV